MIRSITVRNNLGYSYFLSLTDPYKTGLVIESITGLGPPKATINSTDLAMGDGAVYNSSRAEKRNIVFKFRLIEVQEEDGRVIETIEDVRLSTYKMFPLKKDVTLIFETENRTCEIKGYVESNEPDIFSQQETLSVSIVCPDPYFYASTYQTVLNGINAMFEFPFSNESLDTPLIEFGRYADDEGQRIVYEGDADCGVVLTIEAEGPASNLVITNYYPNEIFTLNKSFEAGEVVTVSSITGDIYARSRVPGSAETNILSYIPKDSDWLHMVRGYNLFSYTAQGSENLKITIDGYILYEGV